MMILFLLACLVVDDEVGRALDPDGDGYGPEEDCGPMDATVYPGALEVWYNGVDQDCSGGSDYDQDGDGFASDLVPDERGQIGPDCDDQISTVYPGAAEFCDDYDNDCDRKIDEGTAAPSVWDVDTDGDGYYGSTVVSCSEPTGIVAIGGDCNDSDATVYPGADEVCGDGIVNSCEGTEEEASGLCSWRGSYRLWGANTKLVEGIGDESYVGMAVIGLGDMDNDGRGDLLIGATGATGAAYLMLSSGSLAELEPILNLESADFTLVGEESNDYAGEAVSNTGDIDGDGEIDIIVGAPGNDSSAERAGAAYLLLSSELLDQTGSTINLSLAKKKFVGESSNDEAGGALSSTNLRSPEQDTYLLIGADHNNDGGDYAGAVYFISTTNLLANHESIVSLGDADVKLVGTEYDQIGRSVSGGGDVDGDGQGDVLVGSLSQGAYVIFADSMVNTSGTTLGIDDVDCWLTEGANGIYAGQSVSIVGDVEGDGLADFVVGDRFNSTGGLRVGIAYLFFSSGALTNLQPLMSLDTADIKLLGQDTSEAAGAAVSGAGDVDADGRADLLVGGPSNGAGRAYLLLSSGSLSQGGGTLALAEAEVDLTGEEIGDVAGSSLSSAGDVNGDGLDDILIGAPYHNDYAGAAYLLFGRSF